MRKKLKSFADMQAYLDECLKIIRQKPFKTSKNWSALFLKYEDCCNHDRHIKEPTKCIAYALNYLKQFNFDSKSPDYAGHSKHIMLDKCLSRLAWKLMLERKKYAPLEIRAKQILKIMKMKNYKFRYVYTRSTDPEGRHKERFSNKYFKTNIYFA